MIAAFSNVTDKAVRVLIPFVSTHFNDVSFSIILQVKSKQRNRLDMKNCMRCVIKKYLHDYRFGEKQTIPKCHAKTKTFLAIIIMLNNLKLGNYKCITNVPLKK